MNEDYGLIAPFYDVEHARFDEDIDLYMNFAELRGGPLLELACGSGRLLLPLAQAGYEVTGVDTSASMLALARNALDTAGGGARRERRARGMRCVQPGKKRQRAYICPPP